MIDGITKLRLSKIPTPELDARILLSYVINYQNTIYMHNDIIISKEVNRVSSDLQSKSQPIFIDEVTTAQGGEFSSDDKTSENGDTETDPLFDEAVKLVTESGNASISSVQRKLRIGYNRAARIVEKMEEIGIVSELESNGKREVLAPPPPED